MGTAAVLLAALLLQADDPGRLQRETVHAELALYEQLRTFRDCSTPASTDWLAGEGRRLGLDGIEVGSVQEGDGTPLRIDLLDVRGWGDLYDVHLFLRRIAYEHDLRAIGFETLRLAPASDGLLTFEARLRDVCWTGEVEPATGEAGDVAALLRVRLQRLHAVSSEASRITGAMQHLPLIKALEAVEFELGSHPVMLREARFEAPDLTLRGVAVGTQARDAVPSALRDAGFEVVRVDWTASGPCRAFTAVARLAAPPPVDRDVLAKEVFDERIDVLCAPPPPATPKLVKARGSGALSLQARDVDVAAVFLLLHELGGRGFVVEPGVEGRVSLDLAEVTIAEALEALGSAGVAHAGPGPLHRICRKPCRQTARAPAEYSGEPVSFVFSQVEARDILRLFREISGLEIYARDVPAAISIYAREVPWDQLFEAILASLGRTYTIDGNRVYIDRDGTAVENLPTPRWRRTLEQTSLASLAIEDLELAAATRLKAWVRVPGSSSRLLALEPGAELLNGRVEEVSGDAVKLRASNGREVVLRFR